VNEKPILFKTEMVKAIIQGKKTQTRRVLYPQPKSDIILPAPLREYTDYLKKMKKKGFHNIVTQGYYANHLIPNPKASVGDILWVKETFSYVDFCGDDNGYVYKASENGKNWSQNTENWKWKPALFFPKEAARLFLKISNIKLEPLQDITEEEARKEGFDSLSAFLELWDKIAKKGSKFQDNPAVYAYDFVIDDLKYNDYERE